ncbi:MAG: hypothetical protein AAF403_03280, partial [Pseudomonadota bacterium]
KAKLDYGPLMIQHKNLLEIYKNENIFVVKDNHQKVYVAGNGAPLLEKGLNEYRLQSTTQTQKITLNDLPQHHEMMVEYSLQYGALKFGQQTTRRSKDCNRSVFYFRPPAVGKTKKHIQTLGN